MAGYREELLPEGHYIVPAFFCTVVGGTLRTGDDITAVEFVDPRALADRPTVPTLEDVFRDAGLLDRETAGRRDGGTAG